RPFAARSAAPGCRSLLIVTWLGQRRAPIVYRRNIGASAGRHRPPAKAARAYQTVIKHDGARHADIDGKAGGNFHHEFASREHLGREGIALGPEDIGGAGRMTEAREFH